MPEDIYQDNRELFELASSACEHIQRLVDSLLDVAKFTTGEMPLALSNIYLGEMIKDNAYHQSLVEWKRGVTIEAIIPDNLPPVLVDTEKLDRVLTNLLDNALKYTPDDGLVMVEADVDSDYIVISVIDQGPGIPPD